MSIVLSDMEKRSELWMKLAEHYASRLDVYRLKLESPQLSLEETNFYRGRVAECREFLKLADPLPIVPPSY